MPHSTYILMINVIQNPIDFRQQRRSPYFQRDYWMKLVLPRKPSKEKLIIPRLQYLQYSEHRMCKQGIVAQRPSTDIQPQSFMLSSLHIRWKLNLLRKHPSRFMLRT